MTKCRDLPRALGTLPAGSAVRLKSRFALYSASGAADAARERPFPEPRAGVPEARVAETRLELDRVTFVAAFDPLLLLGADFFAAERLLPDLVPDRLAAMLPLVARSMPSTPAAP